MNIHRPSSRLEHRQDRVREAAGHHHDDRREKVGDPQGCAQQVDVGVVCGMAGRRSEVRRSARLPERSSGQEGKQGKAGDGGERPGDILRYTTEWKMGERRASSPRNFRAQCVSVFLLTPRTLARSCATLGFSAMMIFILLF